ncbi:MAG: squalene--hopene cyclase, partial [Candidatus Eremiobacteraeota bacterium]|nr:squalene--hopene cyclase [Candidatus Eremiobacteraeota bacterium]
VALKVLGVDAEQEAMQRALRLIRRLGGVARARVFTKIWLALFGQYPWDGIPSLPPELIYLPPRAPFSFYDFACWARGTIAPLTIVLAERPRRELGVGTRELVVAGSEAEMHRVPGSGAFWWFDALLKRYDKSPRQPWRKDAQRRVADWIVERQERDGSWGGIQPPWVYSLIALNLEGYALDHPVMRSGLAGMERFVLCDDDQGWRFQACMSPVWDTAWAMRALRAAGLERDHPALRRATQWILDEQIPADERGDWRLRCHNVPNGGWAFEFDNDMYPDVDDTTIVVLALLEASDAALVRDAVERARRWTVAMRSSNGGWAAFDRDNTRELVYRIPFADFGALIDPPTEDVTAHVVEMLAALGCDERDADVASGLRFLRRTQRADGAWYGRWGVNYIYGTWCAISALAAVKSGADMIGRGVSWLVSVQNDDGGWGETCHSYVDPSFGGVGRSTPSQTAWAVNALQLAGGGHLAATERGLAFLREQQRPDGTWDEPEYTGTGFPRDFYINYHLYRHVFPLLALGEEVTR